MLRFRSVIFAACFSLLCSANQFRFDYDYNEQADGWLKFHIIPSTFREARMRCLAEGAVLASPLTNKLKNAIINFVQRRKVESVISIFTGVHASFSKGDYTSIEGVPLSRIPITWASGEPNNLDNAESCLAMRTDNAGSMSDVRCTDVLSYVCYKKYAHLTLNNCGTTDYGYTLEPRTGSCYKFHRRGLPWSQAFMTCLAEGGYLAVINSEIEAEIVREIYERNPDNTIRSQDPGALGIGFHDWGERTSFLTIHGETLDDAGYQAWADHAPDNATRPRTNDPGEFCGTVFRNGKLNDNFCNSPVAFLCEKSRESLLNT